MRLGAAKTPLMAGVLMTADWGPGLGLGDRAELI